jgi:hypothetical protein
METLVTYLDGVTTPHPEIKEHIKDLELICEGCTNLGGNLVRVWIETSDKKYQLVVKVEREVIDRFYKDDSKYDDIIDPVVVDLKINGEYNWNISPDVSIAHEDDYSEWWIES